MQKQLVPAMVLKADVLSSLPMQETFFLIFITVIIFDKLWHQHLSYCDTSMLLLLVYLITPD